MARSINASLLSIEDKKMLQAIQADIASLYAALAVLLPKLDADTGVIDTNYTALCTPAAEQSAQ